jgi:cytochrome c peroxidase
MKRIIVPGIVSLIVVIACFSFKESSKPALYISGYKSRLKDFAEAQQQLMAMIAKSYLPDSTEAARIKAAIHETRLRMKGLDFWLRYLSPNDYRSINGPLPVEWETEVFEKFEKPYRREGAGLTLAELYLDEPMPQKDSLVHLIKSGIAATENYAADTITNELGTFHHFLLCNRLYLLNLAAIYTTGFECPDTARIIPELRDMLKRVRSIYDLYNESFATTPITANYLARYDSAIAFVNAQPGGYSSFNHFRFLRDYVNPLFAMNAEMIREYGVVSHSLVDYSLNKGAASIFSKQLYRGQNARGIFTRIKDTAVLAEIERIGKLLFYDPILSGNNMRSCASCHKPEQFFADTTVRTAFAFDHKSVLSRNTPSLVNAEFNHLIMLDGAHISLQHQASAVTTNPREMGGAEEDIVRKVMSCDEYRKAFTRLLVYTPQEPKVVFEHIASALTTYYCRFSEAAAPFDEAINSNVPLNAQTIVGFNVFMSKAQCGTCHFVPHFNGVKPPYVGSEFEVLGVPADTGYKMLSPDSGRYAINPSFQTLHAFRTGTVRNAARTAPYMHNGVFRTLREVIDFYDKGGGAGHGLMVENQTLNADKLHLSESEKKALIAFMESLTERIRTDAPPDRLPRSHISALNSRKPGGDY